MPLSLSLPGQLWGLPSLGTMLTLCLEQRLPVSAFVSAVAPPPHHELETAASLFHYPAKENDSLVCRGRNGIEGKWTEVVALSYQDTGWGSFQRCRVSWKYGEGPVRGSVIEALSLNCIGTI